MAAKSFRRLAAGPAAFLCAASTLPARAGDTTNAALRTPDRWHRNHDVAPDPGPARASFAGTPKPAPVPRPPVSVARDVTWSALVLIYPESDFSYVDQQGRPGHYRGSLGASQVTNFEVAARNFADLVPRWSNGQGKVSIDVKVIERPLGSLTEWVAGRNYWPTPTDVQPELDANLPGAAYDSVIVLWNSGSAPCEDFWGLAHAGTLSLAGRETTYATVRYAEDWLWQMKYPGEVIVHEWLHGLEGYYTSLGYSVPDLHSGPDFNYYPDGDGSWASWYGAYMQGKVVTRASEYCGISPAVWRSGSLLKQNRPLPVQALRPISNQPQAKAPALKWSPVPADRYQVAVYQQGVPQRPVFTLTTRTPAAALPAARLRPGVVYTWTLWSAIGAATSAPGDTMSFTLGRPERWYPACASLRAIITS